MTLALEVVAEEAPAPSDAEVDCSASVPWLVLACTCVSVCCSELGGICELEVLGACSPELETEVSDATVLEVVCIGGAGELEVLGDCSPELETEFWDEVLLEVGGWASRSIRGLSSEAGTAVLEKNALVSASAVESGWDEVTPFPRCSVVDKRVICGTASPTLD